MSRFPGNIIKLPNVTPTQSSASGVWSLKDQMVYQRNNLWPFQRDPYFNYTTLLLQGNVPNTTGPQAMTQPLAYNSDASTNNFLVTPNGDVGPRPFSPYFGGNYSVYFDGSGTLLRTTASALSSSAFTVEGWVYLAGASNQTYTFFDFANAIGLYGMRLLHTSSGNLEVAFYPTSSSSPVIGTITSSFAGLYNKWVHIAVTYDGSVYRMFVDGQSVGTPVSSATQVVALNVLTVGARSDSSPTQVWLGYISNFRYVTGAALYTSNFTPSLAPLSIAASGTTRLLICQSNRFIDNSSSPYTLTVTGTPRITDNSPFVSTDFTTGAGYFDGTGDYLNAADSEAFNFGNGDFTVEMWTYLTGTSSASAYRMTGQCSSAVFDSDLSFAMMKEDVTDKYLSYVRSGSTNYETRSSLSRISNAWVHIALVRSGGNLNQYINGQLDGQSTTLSTNTINNSTKQLSIGRQGELDAGYFLGNITSYRIVKGVAVYTGNFTPPSLAPLARSGAASAASYPSTTNVNTSFAESATSLLTLQTRAPSQNINFIDSSPNEFIVTKNGNTTQGTFSPFSPTGWSNYFSSGNYLTPPAAGIPSGAGTAFTIEAWVYPTVNASTLTIVGQGSAGSFLDFYVNSNNQLVIDIKGTVNISASANNAITTNQWQHVAVTRTAANLYTLYINGNSVGTPATNSTSLASSSSYILGVGTGYISNLRVTTGQSLFSGNFTPSTSPLTTSTVGATGTNAASSLTGTVALLICQSNRFLDQTGKTITITGSPSVQAFSPFAPAQSYIPSQIGGSGYFDSSGDSLTIASAPALNMTGDFCMEGWAYPTAANITFAWKYTAGVVSTSEYFWAIDGTNRLSIALDGGGGEDYFRTAVNTINLNAWNHCVVTRVGTEVRQFINGVLQSYNTTSRTLNVTSTTFLTNAASGYISGLRIMRGSIPDIYQTTATTTGTAVFTPPTAPPVATQNTSLLLNFTNGGIVDATGKNNLETVANAQVSTVQAKWPPGSMYFNGSTGKAVGPSSPNLNMGSGDFTVECWVYWAGGSLPYQNFVGSNSASFTGNATFFRVWGTSATLGLANKVGIGNPTHDSTSSVYSVNSLTANTWTHVAATRSSGIIRLFINGTLERTGSSDTSTYDFGDNGICVGQSPWDGANGWYGGYIDDLRITKGYARYTASFTPPTGPFPIG